MSVFFYEKENVLFVREDHPMIGYLVSDGWIDVKCIHQTSLYSFGFIKVYPPTLDYVLAKYTKTKTPKK